MHTLKLSRRFLLGLALACGGSLVAAAQQTSADYPVIGAGALDPLVAWSGPVSAIKKPEFVRITGREAWEQLWERHEGGVRRDNVGRPFAPEINFEKCEVVAIFQGTRTNSNGVFAVQVIDEPDRIRFRFDERTYQVAFALNDDGAKPPPLPPCAPYGLFVLPRSSKPIVIEENVQGMKDQPAKWKQCAELR